MDSRKARRHGLWIGAGLWIGVLLLLAAGSSVAPSSPPADDPAEPDGLSLRLAISDALPQLDPFLQNTGVSNWILYGNVFEGLIRFSDGEPRPSLASSWVQENELTWLFTLRPGVTFHDGRPVTVDDVVASLRRALDHPRSAIAARVAQIEEVEARGNPDVDRLIEAAMVADEAARRREIYEQISRILAAERPIIPLVRPLGIFGLRRDLAWAAPPTAALTLSEMSIRR